MALANDLPSAIDQRQFALHYQPQVYSESGELVAMEALLRWRPHDVLKPPSQFVPVLEDAGLITRITAWVLRQACAALQQMSDRRIQNV